MLKAHTQTFTYIIQEKGTDNYKIGQSRNPEKRVKQLQTGSASKLELLLYVPSDRWLERRLHRMLFLSSKRGEWFTLSPSKLNMILSYITERYGSFTPLNSACDLPLFAQYC